MSNIVLRKFDAGNIRCNIVRFYEDIPSYNVTKYIESHKLQLQLNDDKKYNIQSVLSDCSVIGFTCDVAIMFSGGLDSLSLALKHLEQGEKVALLSLSFDKKERYLASLTTLILKQLYGQNSVEFYTILGDIVLTGQESTAGLCQQPLAAMLATFMPSNIRDSAKSLEIAYCMNDDALSFLPELKVLYDTTGSFKFKPFPPISFPLVKCKHVENIEYVKNIEEKCSKR